MESTKKRKEKSMHKRINNKKMNGIILTNGKLNKNISASKFEGKLLVNVLGILKSSPSKNQIDDSKCNFTDSERNKIYCPRSLKKNTSSVCFGFDTRTTTKDKMNKFPIRSSTIPYNKNVEKNNLLVKRNLTHVNEKNVNISEIFVPRSINSAPNLKGDALIKTTNKNYLPKMVIPNKQIWREKKDALIELLHSNENVVLDSCELNERFQTNSKSISNTNIKDFEENKRDFEKLQNLNQDALTVLRSQNRNTIKKGKRKKIDKSPEERGSKIPKVVAKEKIDNFDDEVIEFNISKCNACQLSLSRYQEFSKEKILQTQNVDYNESIQKNEVPMVQNPKPNQPFQELDECQLFQDGNNNQIDQNVDSNQTLQNINSNQQVQKIDSNQIVKILSPNQIIQNVDPNQLVQNDEVYRIQNLSQNQLGEHDEVVKYKNLNQHIEHVDFKRQLHTFGKNINKRDFKNKHIIATIHNIEQNDIAHDCYSFQDTNHLHIMIKNVKFDHIRNENIVKKDTSKFLGQFSSATRPFQSDIQNGRKLEEESFQKNISDVPKPYHLPRKIKNKDFIKELKFQKKQKKHSGIESSKIKVQTNPKKRFYDNSSFNFNTKITRQRNEENIKHTQRERGDDGLNMLLDEVREKFCCIKNRKSNKKKPQFIEAPKEYLFQVDTTYINSDEISKSNGLLSYKKTKEVLTQDNNHEKFEQLWFKKYDKHHKQTTHTSSRTSFSPLVHTNHNSNDMNIYAKRNMESHLQDINTKSQYGFESLNESKESKPFIKTKHKHVHGIEKISNKISPTIPFFDKYLQESRDLEDVSGLFSKKHSPRQILQVECHIAPEEGKNQFGDTNLDEFYEDKEMKNFCYEDFIPNFLQKGVQEGLLEPSCTQINSENKKMNLEPKIDLFSTTSTSISTSEVQEINSSFCQDSCSKKILNVKNKEYLPNSISPISIFCNNTVNTKKDMEDKIVPSLHHIQKTSQRAVEILDCIVKKFKNDRVGKSYHIEGNEEVLQNNKCKDDHFSNKNTKEFDAPSVKPQELLQDKVHVDNYNFNNLTNFCDKKDFNVNSIEISQTNDLEHKSIDCTHKNIALVPIDESFGEILERLTSNDILQNEVGQNNVHRTTQTYPIIQLGNVVDSQTNTSPNSMKENIEQVQIIVHCMTKANFQARFLEVETDTHDLPTFSKSSNPCSLYTDWNDSISNSMKYKNNENNINFSLNLGEGYNCHSYCRNDMDVGEEKDHSTKNSNLIETLKEDLQDPFKDNHAFEINDAIICTEFCKIEDPIRSAYILDHNNLIEDFDNKMNVGKTIHEYYQYGVASKWQFLDNKDDYLCQSTCLCTYKDKDINANEIRSCLCTYRDNCINGILSSPLELIRYDKINKNLFINEQKIKYECVEKGSNAFDSHTGISFANSLCANENILEDIVYHNGEKIVNRYCKNISKRKENQRNIGDYNTTTYNHKYCQACTFPLDYLKISESIKNNPISLSCSTLDKFENISIRNENTQDYCLLKVFFININKKKLEKLNNISKVNLEISPCVLDGNEIATKSRCNIKIVLRNAITSIHTKSLAGQLATTKMSNYIEIQHIKQNFEIYQIVNISTSLKLLMNSLHCQKTIQNNEYIVIKTLNLYQNFKPTKLNEIATILFRIMPNIIKNQTKILPFEKEYVEKPKNIDGFKFIEIIHKSLNFELSQECFKTIENQSLVEQIKNFQCEKKIGNSKEEFYGNRTTYSKQVMCMLKFCPFLLNFKN